MPRRDVLLLGGLGLLLLMPWLLVAGLLWTANHPRQLQPIVTNGFMLSAWHMPSGYYYPNIMEYCDGPGIGITCLSNTGSSYYSNFNHWIDLDVAADGSLTTIRSVGLNGRWPMMSEHNGRMLSIDQQASYINNYQQTKPPLAMSLDWPLQSAPDERTKRNYSLELADGLSLCLVTLKNDRLALIDVTPEPDGSLRLRIQPPNKPPEVVQRIPRGVTSGPAYVHDTATQFIYDLDGNVWIFDAKTERFAKAVEFKPLGDKLVNPILRVRRPLPDVGYTALCDNFAAIHLEDIEPRVHVFSTKGEFKFKTVDPNAQRSTGWSRLFGGWPFYRGYGGFNSYTPDFTVEEGRRGAARGRRVPVDTLANSYTNYYLRMVPYAADRLAIADYAHQRLILIEPE